MKTVFKLEKWENSTLRYEIFFKDKVSAWAWVIKNPKEGFFKISIREVPLEEKLTRNINYGLVIRN